jgi:DNA invertase Pin-like site-specific DNA recombinase
MKIGYCRVSTPEQDATRQILKMRQLGIEERFIFVDKVRHLRIYMAYLLLVVMIMGKD